MTGTRQPVPVIAVVMDDRPLPVHLRETLARRDDAFWAAYVRRPFTWQRYLNWWVARRWVIPRDIRRQ